MISLPKPADVGLHFVGIGGIGMSGIAQVFFNQGYRVTGSDMAESDSTKKLRQMGIPLAIGHSSENVGHSSVVVISSAVKRDNPEVVEAHRRRIPVIPRAEMLGELMRGKVGIAVAGTHGKTTTTTLLAHVMLAANEDPTVVIGGKVDAIDGNAKLGQGRWVVAEADESDGSFLHLPLTYGIVTNIDNDHLDHYGTLENVENAFVEFVGKVPFYGVAAVCGDDPGVRRCLKRFTKPIVTYGFGSDLGDWDYRASDVRVDARGSHFKIEHEGKSWGEFSLFIPGKHYVSNALAVAAVSHRMGVSIDAIRKGLGEFRGVKRRFEVRWKDEKRRRMMVDDYAHHPTEIQATLSAARQAWTGRVLCAFQPHRFSRTRQCYEGFLNSFRGADRLWVTDIYPAGEEPIEGVHSRFLVEEIRRRGLPLEVSHVATLEDAAREISAEMRDGDLLLTMGAGSITRLPDLVAK